MFLESVFLFKFTFIIALLVVVLTNNFNLHKVFEGLTTPLILNHPHPSTLPLAEKSPAPIRSLTKQIQL